MQTRKQKIGVRKVGAQNSEIQASLEPLPLELIINGLTYKRV